MAYGGIISLSAIFYRTALVIIITQVLIKAHKSNLSKIKMTNYIRFLSFLTYIYLLTYSIVILLLKSLTDSSVSDSDKEMTKVQAAVSQALLAFKNNYGDQIARLLLSTNQSVHLIFFYVLNLFLYVKMVLMNLSKYEDQMYEQMLTMSTEGRKSAE